MKTGTPTARPIIKLFKSSVEASQNKPINEKLSR